MEENVASAGFPRGLARHRRRPVLEPGGGDRGQLRLRRFCQGGTAMTLGHVFEQEGQQ